MHRGALEYLDVGDTGADWSEVFARASPSRSAYVRFASKFAGEVLDGLLRIGFLYLPTDRLE